MPQVSVIVPVYNAAEALPRAIASLQNQTLADLEIILVNDGSTDNSPEICQRVAEKDVRIRVFSQPNSGVSVARNTGLAHSTGEFIGFLDSDDIAKPEMIATLVKRMLDTNADMVMGGYEKVNGERVTSTVTLPYEGILTGKDVAVVSWSMAFWGGYRNHRRLHTLYGSTWPNLYRAKIIRKFPIEYPVGVTIGEDLLFNLQYLKVCNSVAFVNQSLYQYNAGNPSATRRVNPQLWNKYLDILNRAKAILHDDENDELQMNFYRQTLAYAINVIEEQGPLYASEAERRLLIDALCKDGAIRNASKQLLLHGNSLKERMWGLLFYGGITRLIAKRLIN